MTQLQKSQQYVENMMTKTIVSEPFSNLTNKRKKKKKRKIIAKILYYVAQGKLHNQIMPHIILHLLLHACANNLCYCIKMH